MPPAAAKSLALLFLALYMWAWWFAVWFAIRRREQFVIPFFGVLLLGLGVPMLLAGARATSLNPLPYTLAMVFWIALPFLMVAVFVLIGFLRSRRNEDAT